MTLAKKDVDNPNLGVKKWCRKKKFFKNKVERSVALIFAA
jgi:hypothetical protein